MKRLFLLSLLCSLLGGTLLHAQPDLRFGAIHLGMKLSEIRALVDKGDFMLMSEEKFKESTFIILMIGDSAGWSDPDLNRIGCRNLAGRYGPSRCIRFSSLILFLHDDHIYSISAPSVSIHPSDTALLNQHVDDALSIVWDMYGKPARIRRLPLTKAGLAGAGNDFPKIAEWTRKIGKKENEEISVEIYLSYGTAENGEGGEKVYNVWIKAEDEARWQRAIEARNAMEGKQKRKKSR